MSRETLEWLNTHTLIGFTEKRGNAWHHRAGASNHYVGGIPVDDVRKRLFSWHAEEHHIHVGRQLDEEEIVGPFGNLVGDAVPGYKAWVHPETGETLGVHKTSRAIHQYDEWLLDTTADLLDDELQIGSAGLLRGGRVAWLQVEVPDTIETPEGIRFRPFILARSSMDGSIATTFSRSVTNTVCDNTMAIAAREHGGQKVVFRASGDSEVKLLEAREALGIVYTAADDFAREVAELTAIHFSDYDFDRLLGKAFPMPEDPTSRGGKVAAARAERRRTFMRDFYNHDIRVAPWKGTAFGAWQAFNTYDQHERPVRGDNRVERNQLQVVRGQQDREDAKVLGVILELAS